VCVCVRKSAWGKPRLCISLIMKMRPHGHLHMAPVCSSWVFLNRSTAGRSNVQPRGDTSQAYVREGNKQAVRCVVMCLLANWRQLSWTLEQPQSSLLHHHPAWQWLLGKCGVRADQHALL
jgi:hypothetical protein